MALNGIIFDERYNTSKNWRNILKKIFPDGILVGCNLSYTSNSLTIGDGYLVACGGVVQCNGAETIAITPQIANGYLRLKLKIDLNQEASSTSSNQTMWEIDYAATQTFPELIQEDINGTESVYEIMVCIAQITDNNITGITKKANTYTGVFGIDGGVMNGDIILGAGRKIKGTQYGTGKPIEVIWLGNSSNDNIWIGGNSDQETIGGGIYFHIGTGKQMKLIRGTDASVELLDAGNFAPGTCKATTENAYANGAHTHKLEINNSIGTAYEGTLYLGYDAKDHRARLAGYYDGTAKKDYAQLALSNMEGNKTNAVNVYEDKVVIDKGLEVKQNAAVTGDMNVAGTLRLTSAPTHILGKSSRYGVITLMQVGANSTDNFWIGITNTEAATVTHHGSTYISGGMEGHIRAVVKPGEQKAAETYEMLHMGNAGSLLGNTFAAKNHTHNYNTLTIGNTLQFTNHPTQINGTSSTHGTIALMHVGKNSTDNLWIGIADAGADTQTHEGNTYLSAGLGGHIRAVCKPGAQQAAATYEMLHMGNVKSLLEDMFAAKSHAHTSLDRPTPDVRVGTSGDGKYFRIYKCDTDWTQRDNFTSLGSEGSRWKQLYAATSTIATSDARMKEEIADIEGAKELILNLKPRQYRMSDGESGRTHYGMIAQEVKEAMTAAGIEDFGGYVRSPLEDDGDPETAAEEDVRYGLRYEEFIAPLIATVQAQQKQIEALEKRIEALEGAK